MAVIKLQLIVPVSKDPISDLKKKKLSENWFLIIWNRFHLFDKMSRSCYKGQDHGHLIPQISKNITYIHIFV